MPTHHLGYIARADELHLDLGAEPAPQIRAEAVEVDFLVFCAVVEDQPGTVVAVLGLDELNVLNLQLAGPLPAGDQRSKLFLLPELLQHKVPWRGAPLDGPQPLRVKNLVWFDVGDDLPELPPALRHHNDMIARLNVAVWAGVKVVKLAQLLESYANCVNHERSAQWPVPTPHWRPGSGQKCQSRVVP